MNVPLSSIAYANQISPELLNAARAKYASDPTHPFPPAVGLERSTGCMTYVPADVVAWWMAYVERLSAPR